MGKKSLFAGLVGLLMLSLALGACGQTITFGNAVRGSGVVASETRAVSGFSGVSLNNSGTLKITTGDTESLTIQAEDNLLPLLTSEVKGNMLELGTKGSISLTKPLHYILTVKKLNAVELHGSGSIEALDINTGDMRVELAGSGTILLTGKADNQDINIGGSGNYQGFNLESQNAKVAINGSGDVNLKVNTTLNVNIGGSGSVNYIGDPNINKSIFGSGKVVKHS